MNINFKHTGNITTLVIAINESLILDAPHVPDTAKPFVQNALSDRKDVFQGKIGQEMLIMLDPKESIKRVLVVGVSEKEATPFMQRMLLLGAHAARALSKHKISTATIGWHSFSVNLEKGACATRASASFGQGFSMANNHFDKYKNKKTKPFSVEGISFVDIKNMPKETWHTATSVLEGIFLARDLVNEPGNVINPETFAQHAASLEELDVKVTILKGNDLKKLKMGALMAVGRASAVPPRLLILEWKGNTGQDHFEYGFVGKGVTYDTGGLCIKPARAMLDMKGDMAGGAAVIGAMLSLAKQKAPVNVVAAIPLAENMISGDAYRPGDVLQTHAGHTVEVIDTDAEGRLVLADALSYISRQYKPKNIVDLATLTGAIIVSLGLKMAGLFGNNEELLANIKKASKNTGEKVWQLPISADYDASLKSSVADVANLSSEPGAGSITAAQFLQRFVTEKQSWAHLDVAGVTLRAEESPLYDTKFATGYGVRLLTALALGEEIL
ncbi:MAG: leucyl aminopeptidase [Alphaproteobacteria bacterium]|nr:leucyl aminopeptidase [Alphaproteobacteria bacterium]